ncbi:MAG: rRNA maturation RNase YbeY [Anaerolineae bacterium]
MRMTHHLVDVQVEEQVGDVDTTPIENAARLTLMSHPLDEPCELVIVISDDAALEDLNRRFRGVGHPTDVLAFPDDTRGPFSAGDGGAPRYLGDIVISLERAREQAEEAGGTLDQELQLLTVHGVLHLLGYDHGNEQEREQMWAIQSEILRLLDADIPLPD